MITGQLKRDIDKVTKTDDFSRRAYNFHAGDVVLVSQIERPRHKLSSIWRGPFVIKEITGPRRCTVESLDGKTTREAHFERIKYVDANLLNKRHDFTKLIQFHNRHEDVVVDLERIIGHELKKEEGRDRLHLKVEYKGFPGETYSIPYTDVFAQEMIEEFVERSGGTLPRVTKTQLLNHAADLRRHLEPRPGDQAPEMYVPERSSTRSKRKGRRTKK